jgi:hypothetical protein
MSFINRGMFINIGILFYILLKLTLSSRNYISIIYYFNKIFSLKTDVLIFEIKLSIFRVINLYLNWLN